MGPPGPTGAAPPPRPDSSPSNLWGGLRTRPDFLLAYGQGRYRDVLLTAGAADPNPGGWWTQPDKALARAQGRWDELGGQWFKDFDPGFWNRPDVQAVWTQARYQDVYAKYLRERGAPI
jgi:hypothetical protein